MSATMSKGVAKIVANDNAVCGFDGFEKAEARMAKLYNALTPAEKAEYWSYRAQQARTLGAAEHCQRMAQRVQA